jgi:hypothetical protein
MKLQSISLVIALLIPGALGNPQQNHQEDRPVESEHIAGPHGLEGWTLIGVLPDDSSHEQYPFTLVIAKNGKVLRKINGSAFIWRWIFWNDGRQVAYESGPLHFGMECELYDLKTGRVLHSVDCWRGIPGNAPAWLVALEKAR